MKNFGLRMKGWLNSSGVSDFASVCIRGVSSALARPTFLIGVIALLVPILVILVVSRAKAILAINVDTISDTPASGHCTLREAIANANAAGQVDVVGNCFAGTGNDTITFSPGLIGTIDIHANGTLPAIVHTVDIDGAGASIAVSGANSVAVMVVNSAATLVLDTLTIENGSTAGSGGGVANEGTLTVINSTFSGNSASGNGGAILSNSVGGSLTVTNSIFSNNSAGSGGGAIFDNDKLTTTGSTFTTNTAGVQGGAVFVGAANDATISNSTFTSNTQTPNVAADDGGGAIYTPFHTTTITGSTFSLNTATSNGGAIYADFTAIVNVSESTFANNSAAFSGGAVLTYNSATLTLFGSTLSGNTALAGDGGATSQNNNSLITSSLTVTDSILAGSGTGKNCGGTPGTVTDGGNNVSDDNTCGFGGTGNNVASAGLSPAGLANNGGPTETIALQSTSPAIGLVPNSTTNCPGMDQRGVHTPSTGNVNCDAGAFEHGGSGTVNTLTDPLTPGGGLCSLCAKRSKTPTILTPTRAMATARSTPVARQ